MKINIDIKDIVLKEIEEGYTTLRTQMTLVTQIVTVLILANVYVLGYLLKSNELKYLWMGAIFSTLILLVRYISFKMMIPIYYTVYKFEVDNNEKLDLLGMIYLRVLEPSIVKKFDKILLESNENIRVKLLQNISSPSQILFSKGSKSITIAVIFLIIIQLLYSLVIFCFK